MICACGIEVSFANLEGGAVSVRSVRQITSWSGDRKDTRLIFPIGSVKMNIPELCYIVKR